VWPGVYYPHGEEGETVLCVHVEGHGATPCMHSGELTPGVCWVQWRV